MTSHRSTAHARAQRSTTLHPKPSSIPQALTLAGLAVVGTAHFAYPASVRFAARRSRARGLEYIAEPPSITVVIPAHNEAEVIAQKLEDTLKQEYPADRLEILVVDDASTDATADLAEAFAPDVRTLRLPYRHTKSGALNAGVAASQGEIVIFTDATGSLAPGSLLALVRPFADPRIAVTGGTKVPVGQGAHGTGESIYWRLETALRDAEGHFGAAVGVDGGVYAVRRDQFAPIPSGVYADDLWIPLNALERGLRVGYVSEARASESLSLTKQDDFERRSRIAAGVWRESIGHLELADPRRGWVSAAFVSHRLLRSMAVPAILPALLPITARWARTSTVGRVLYWAQCASWTSAALGAQSNNTAFAVPYQFAMMNLAALNGGLRHFRRRQDGQWKRTQRGAWISTPLSSPRTSQLARPDRAS